MSVAEEYKGLKVPEKFDEEAEFRAGNCDDAECSGISCHVCILHDDFKDVFHEWEKSKEVTKPKSANELMEEAFEKVSKAPTTGSVNANMFWDENNALRKPKPKEDKMNGTIYQVVAVENPAPIEVEEQGAVSRIVFGPVIILALNQSTAISKATLDNADALKKCNQERLEVKAVPLG